jgi:hypothetical protein
MGHLARSRVAALRRLASLAIPLLISIPAVASESKHLDSVQTSRGFFNPSIGQDVLIGFTLDAPGRGDVWILDRDGFPTRRLACDESWPEGIVVLRWDGRDDQGRVVADEAYSLKIDVQSETGVWSFFPGNVPGEQLPNQPMPYDARSGVISYELPVPARVHIQAGRAVVDPVSGGMRGPVLKTIANRAPRAGGRVIEMWNGLDESGQIRVFDQPNFAVAIAATALPEASIITVGNGETSFLDHAVSRTGRSLFTVQVPHGRHHQGLSALEDVAPRLVLTPLNARWSPDDRTWLISDDEVLVRINADGPSAAAFTRQEGTILVFRNEDEVLRTSSAGPSTTVRIPIPGGRHHATVNWASPFGPAAVNSLVVATEPTNTEARGGTQ